jgi:hypothetical protein
MYLMLCQLNCHPQAAKLRLASPQTTMLLAQARAASVN